jgi:hypothetical protein
VIWPTVFENDARIVERGPVLGDQHRNFAERILPPHAVVEVGGVGGLDRHLVAKPSAEIAIRTLRPNGEGGEDRKIIIAAP